jgi:hypothetical protein
VTHVFWPARTVPCRCTSRCNPTQIVHLGLTGVAANMPPRPSAAAGFHDLTEVLNPNGRSCSPMIRRLHARLEFRPKR